MLRLLATLLALIPTLALALTASEQRLIEKSKPYHGMLIEAIDTVWPDLPMRSFLAAQVEKESLWNPRAELKTHREYGFGFGQFTITSRFNAFEEVKVMHPSLRDWRYEDRFDPRRQLLAMVVKGRAHYRQCSPLMDGWPNALACSAASYNGGFGGFLSDRRLCSNTEGCNPKKWFGHVENTSLKAKTKTVGYGQSFFEINRGYVRALMRERSPKYIPYLGS